MKLSKPKLVFITLSLIFLASQQAFAASTTCTRANPTVTLTNPNQNASTLGQVLSYNLNVLNNDSAACGVSTYDLSLTVTSGINVYFPEKTLAITPGQTATETLFVGSAPAIPNGTYQMNITATNAADAQSLASVSGSYILYTTTSACTHANPLVTLANPNQVATSLGQVLTYNGSVLNNDPLVCGISNFLLSTTVTSGINVYFPVKTLAINPNQTSDFQVLVGSAPAIADGTYIMDITATNQAAPQATGTGDGSYLLKTTSATCTHANPTVTFARAYQLATSVGQSLYYTVQVTNNDNNSCAASAFTLSNTMQPGLSPYMGVTSLNLNPGETDIAILEVGSAPWVTVGTPYSLSVTATNAVTGNTGTTPSGTYLVNTNPLTVCTHLNPTINFGQAIQTAYTAGQVINYPVFLINNDTPGCGASTFNFSTKMPSSLAASLNTNSLTVNPGQGAQAIIQVNSLPHTANGSYAFSTTISSGSAATQTATASSQYILNTSVPAPNLQAQYQPYALELVSLLSTTSPEYAAAQATNATGDYVSTMKNFRNTIINNLRALDMGQFGPNEADYNPSTLLTAQLLVGNLSAAQYNQYFATQFYFTDYFGMTGNPALSQPPITWFPTNVPGGDASGQYCDFSVMNQLPGAYLSSSNPAYLLKWFQIFSDFSQNQLNSYNQLSPTLQATVVCNPKNTLGSVARINNTIHTLAAFAKALPAPTPPSDWLNSLSPRTDTLTPESLDQIPELQFYEIMKGWTFNYANWLMQIFVPPRGNPASREYALTYLGLLFNVTAPFQQTVLNYPTFLGSPNDIDGPGNGGMLGDLSSTYYNNEAMLERSYNYMVGLATTDRFFLRSYQPNPPSWAATFSTNLTAAQKVFAAMVTPFQELPRVGEYVEQVAPAVWQNPSAFAPWLATAIQTNAASQSIRICQNTFLDCWGAANSTPQFTSIGFPYSGYYAFRKNWGNQSPYLYFTGGASSNGHQVADLNSIQVTAYGRPMLVAVGPSYGYAGQPVGLANYVNDYNTGKTNTIMVNNQPQFRFSVPGNYDSEYESAKQGILPTRWAMSTSYDFAEGVEAWGYGPSGGYQVTSLDYNHQRQIIFVRDLELWIVVDQMVANNATATGAFTQYWHFSPFVASTIFGYTGDQVVINAANKTITTQDPASGAPGLAGPNLSLYQFGTPTLSYSLYNGSTTALPVGTTTPVYAGWYMAGDFGPAYPAPEVWVNWSGSGHQQLLTLLVPNPSLKPNPQIDTSLRGTALQFSETKDLSSGSITGFNVTQANGSSLTFLSSLQANQLTVTLPSPFLPLISMQGTVKTVSGSPILILDDNYGPAMKFLQGNALLVNYNNSVTPATITGIALGVQSISINGQVQALTGDFVFEIVPGSATGTYVMNKVSDIKIPTMFQWTSTSTGLMPQWN